MTKRLMTGLEVEGMMVWLSLFSAGLLLDSKPYRDAIGAAMKASQPITGMDLLLASLLFTPTNVALLSVLAGFGEAVPVCCRTVTFWSTSCSRLRSAATRHGLRGWNGGSDSWGSHRSCR